MNYKLHKNTLFLIVIFLFFVSIFIFSKSLLEIPPGLTGDESSIGTNAILLSRTARDENGRFLPIFTLTIGETDWKQPITMYYIAGLFKIFKPSLFLLRFSSVMIAAVTGLTLFLLVKKLLNTRIALISWLFFITTPLVVIHSHLATENIIPVLFSIGWLFFVYLYSHKQKKLYLLLIALSLGLGFYCYKGMRAIVPIWTLISLGNIIYIFRYNLKKSWKDTFNELLSFIIFLAPFYLIIPFLEKAYAGAVFDSHQYGSQVSLYDFLYSYLSSFDLGFLYIKGDLMLLHSTQKHGVYLVGTFPLWLLGTYQIIKKRNPFAVFVLVSFFLSPLMYGWVNSFHRASRLLFMVPPYIVILSYGLEYIGFIKHKLIRWSIYITASILLIWNFTSFVSYYWTDYPGLLNKNYFGLNRRLSYKIFAKKSKEFDLRPVVEKDIAHNEGESERLYELIYFGASVDHLNLDILPPEGTIILSQREEIPGLTRLNVNLPVYYLHVRE